MDKGSAKWICLIGGGYCVFTGTMAFATGKASIGKARHPYILEGQEAQFYAWVAVVIGIGFLYCAAVGFWQDHSRDRPDDAEGLSHRHGE